MLKKSSSVVGCRSEAFSDVSRIDCRCSSWSSWYSWMRWSEAKWDATVMQWSELMLHVVLSWDAWWLPWVRVGLRTKLELTKASILDRGVVKVVFVELGLLRMTVVGWCFPWFRESDDQEPECCFEGFVSWWTRNQNVVWLAKVLWVGEPRTRVMIDRMVLWVGWPREPVLCWTSLLTECSEESMLLDDGDVDPNGCRRTALKVWMAKEDSMFVERVTSWSPM